jgi:hypothetical protein
MSSTIPLVYIDTNLFAYQLLSSNHSGDIVTRTNKFFKDIQNGKYQATISTFTETEYRSVVRKVISEKKIPITTSEESAAMNDFDTFCKGMGIGLTDSNLLSNNSNTNLVDIFTMAKDTILLC